MTLRFTYTSVSLVPDNTPYKFEVQYVAYTLYKLPNTFTTICKDIVIYAPLDTLHAIGKFCTSGYYTEPLEDVEKTDVIEKAMKEGATHIGEYKLLLEFVVEGNGSVRIISE